MHSHGGNGGSSSSSAGMSMDMGGPDMFKLQRMYWAFTGAVIGLAVVANLMNRLLAAHRLSGRAEGTCFTVYATITAITREISHASISPRSLKGWHSSYLTLGKAAIVMANLVLVLVLCFYGLSLRDEWQWENVGYQTGFITAAQLPLVVLLAGKRNIIGFLTGSSYERLSWLHRWISRTVFLTATLHMGFWFRSWDRYDYIGEKLRTDKISQRGLAAWGVLLWIFLSSFAPLRRWNYEFFLVQHILTFIGFLAAVFVHLPAENKVWIWTPICLYILDRALRSLIIFYHNFGLFSPHTKGVLSCRAVVECAGAGFSRITIKNPPLSWRPGQHIFLQCHGIAPLQAHPFTISTLSEDRQLEFLVKSHAGATKRFLAHAEKSVGLPSAATGETSKASVAIIDGPYGNMRTLRQFDSVLLIAGGCGATFTMPLMRDIVNGWKRQNTASLLHQFFSARGAVTRRLRFIWVIRSKAELAWFSSQIQQAWQDTREIQQDCRPNITLEISIYVTCDTDLEPVKDKTISGSGIELSTLRKVRPLSSASTSSSDKPKAEHVSVKSDDSTSSERSGLLKPSCVKNGQCCCKQVVESAEINGTYRDPTPIICRCNEGRPQGDVQKAQDQSAQDLYSSGADITDSSDKPFQTFTGRPDCKSLIRDVLERACGESAVVVCGPGGLNSDVRESSVALSDERAVCKGSGAYGVYFWEEGFSY